MQLRLCYRFVKQIKISDAESSEPRPLTSKQVDDDLSYSSSNEQKIATKKRKVSYKQKYSERWEIDFKWCEKATNSDYPYCKICCKVIKGNRSHLERHEKNDLHKKNMHAKANLIKIDKALKTCGSNIHKQVKEGELKLAAFIAEHDLSFNITEHLPKLIMSICKDSNIATSLKSSRTKTSETINHSIGPYVIETISNSLKTSYYSIIIDETTDVSTTKCLAVLVRFYSKTQCKVCDTFLGLLEINDGSTASNIYDTLINYLTSVGIKLENMVGFAADNCATMMGHLNGVQSLLRKRIPNLVVIGCVSHSFNLCASNACLKLPRRVEDLVRDIYSHFSFSSRRMNNLKEFQVFCDLKPHKILRPSATRWLSLQQVVDRVLEQYNALILYFTDCCSSAHGDQTHKVIIILDCLKNKLYKLYFFFLSYILKIVNTMNVEFQSERPRIHQLMPRISNLYKQIVKGYMNSQYVNNTETHRINPSDPKNFVPLEDMYMGVHVQELINSDEVNEISKNDLYNFRLNCLHFYIELCSQIKDRFPFQNKLYMQLTWLDPRNIFSDNKAASIVPLMKHFPNIATENLLEDINTEWRLLDELPRDRFCELDLEEFVTELNTYKNALGEKMFKNLYYFLKNILCLPHGSAAAERTFSSLNNIKRKNRNRLSTNTCQNLLLTKEMLSNTTCFDWDPPEELIRKYLKK